MHGRAVPHALLIAGTLGLAAAPRAQPQGAHQIGRLVGYDYRVAGVANAFDHPRLVAEHVVRFPGASYLRLTFAGVRIGEGGFVELLSLRDGELEPLTAATLTRHRNVSAFFNGDAVRVRFYASPRAVAEGFRIAEVAVGFPHVSRPATVCGSDDRQLSNDKRVARIVINGAYCMCTAFLISPGNCFATAGHCFGNFTVFTLAVEFNVPLSDAQGNCVHPPVADQYQWIGSQQTIWKDQGLGNDWAVFKTQANSVTNLHAGQAQGDWFRFVEVPPQNPNVIVTGYGIDATPDLTRERVQQSDSAPLISLEGTTLRYRIDTETGNSGSPVIDKVTGRAIGIHTTGGCKAQSDSNKGTWIWHPDFVAACAKLCSPPDFGTFDDLALPPPCSGSGSGECETLAASLNAGGSAHELVPPSTNAAGDYLIAAQTDTAVRICALELLLAARSSLSVAAAIYLPDASGAPQPQPVRTGTLQVSRQAAWTRASVAPLDLGAGARFFVGITSPGATLTLGAIEHGTLGTHWLRTAAGQTGPHTTTPWAYRVLAGEPGPMATPKLGNRGFPTAGSGFDVTLRQAVPQTAAALIQGFSSRQWGPLPLPFPLQGFGAPQCSLGVSMDFVLVTATDTSGRAAIRIGIPALRSVAGNHLYYQWLVVDPRANAFGAVMSQVGDGRIGR